MLILATLILIAELVLVSATWVFVHWSVAALLTLGFLDRVIQSGWRAQRLYHKSAALARLRRQRRYNAMLARYTSRHRRQP